ncbi:hypothetical protein FEZ60_24170 [Rhodococcus sp. MS16]|uniref:FtsK/SpoIIIE domain-containing protein n=1 Tax=Rhodococcus sp. MS16 TaxID=2579941 RepID=UPI0015620CD0|nr:FtsK/SpoIIIE domain-containing protein [Rhodococcus sp. MS16]NRI68617.1 hypothetical protein [Rhodococcus sp. MS16]
MTNGTSPRETQTLNSALQQVHSRLLGSLDAAVAEIERKSTRSLDLLRKEHARSIALARNNSAQQVIEHSARIREFSESVEVADNTDSLATADFIRLGTIEFPSAKIGVNDNLTVPWIVPLLGRSNMTMVGPPTTELKSAVHKIVLETLAHTAPDQVQVIGYDPHLRGWLAPFSGLKDASSDSIQSITRTEDFDDLLDTLLTDVQRISDTMRGSDTTLLDYRREIGHPIEHLRLVTVFDYPDAVTNSMHQKLKTLARVGPAAGISLFMVRENRSGGSESSTTTAVPASEIDAFGELLINDDKLIWQRHRDMEVRLQGPTVDEIVTVVGSLAKRLKDAAGPKIEFPSIEALDRQWHTSSADGITFAIGKTGRDVVEVTIGDEREQRHNLLVTGAVGQGKSNLLKTIIHSVGQRYSPEEVQMYLLDFKDGVSLYPYMSTTDAPEFLVHAQVLGLESDRDFGLAVLEELDAERVRRATTIKPHGDSISRYRNQVPHAVMPRIILMIDEFQRLFEPSDDPIAAQCAQLLEGIARLGRAYGIHLLLASQSISGISALMARENGLYGQFPIRIALKNSPQEAVNTLTPGNDAPARLKYRGEAIVNLDYGTREANRTVAIAVADDDVLEVLRRKWWNDAKDRTDAPTIFDGAQSLRVRQAISSVQQLRLSTLEGPRAPTAIIGNLISVAQHTAGVSFSAEPGRNFAIIGAGEKVNQFGSSLGLSGNNTAVGILQSAALSLAMQHPRGDARFVSIELIDDTVKSQNNIGLWHALMERLGFPVEVVGRDGVLDILQQLSETVTNAVPGGPVTYVLAFGFDRIGRLDTPDAFANTPADILRTVLRDGPTKSVHFLGWWTNAATYQAHLGFGGEGMVDVMAFLRADQSTVQDFLGPFVTWSVRDNRALWVDRTQLANPTVIIPFSPVDRADVSAYSTAEWGA